MGALGRHVIVEFYDCKPELLNGVVYIEKSMEQAAEKAGATIINSTFHHFSPYGVSGVVVIQESHIAIHSWPEYGFASVDLFTCGGSVDPWIAYHHLKEAFHADHGSAMEMRRGELHLLQKYQLDPAVMRDQKYATLESRGEDSPLKTRDIWFTERNDNLALSFKHSGEKLYEAQSDYQKVEVYNTEGYGHMLTLDGMVMCTEEDEAVYHELIAHVPALTHPNPKNVLIIGGGDGGTARELLKHEALEQVVMVEIDDKVIEGSKKYMPQLSVAFDNPRLDLRIEDGIKFVKEEVSGKYDIVIVDSTDPVGPGEGLFTESFYREVYRILNKDGILVTQSESPRFNERIFTEIFQCYKSIFGANKVHCYLGYIPTYPTGMWSFSYSSKGSAHPLNGLDKQKIHDFCEQNNLDYYNPAIHEAAFALPNFVKAILEGGKAGDGKAAKSHEEEEAGIHKA